MSLWQRAREKWARLTDSDWKHVGEHKGNLLERLRERYGWSHEEAEKDVHKHFQFIPEKADQDIPQ